MIFYLCGIPASCLDIPLRDRVNLIGLKVLNVPRLARPSQEKPDGNCIGILIAAQQNSKGATAAREPGGEGFGVEEALNEEVILANSAVQVVLNVNLVCERLEARQVIAEMILQAGRN